MGLEVNADKVVMKISTTSVEDAVSSGRVIICEETSNAALTSNATTRRTKCGTKVTTDDPEVVLSGSGVVQANVDPGQEVSAMDIIAWMKNKTPLYFYYANANDTSTGANADDGVCLKGEGRFSSCTVTSDVNDPLVTFDWEFTVGGDWSYVPN